MFEEHFLRSVFFCGKTFETPQVALLSVWPVTTYVLSDGGFLFVCQMFAPWSQLLFIIVTLGSPSEELTAMSSLSPAQKSLSKVDHNSWSKSLFEGRWFHLFLKVTVPKLITTYLLFLSPIYSHQYHWVRLVLSPLEDQVYRVPLVILCCLVFHVVLAPPVHEENYRFRGDRVSFCL